MKRVDVKSNACINSSKENNDKDPKFKIGYIVRLLQYESIFAKGYTPSWYEEAFVTKKVNKAALWIYVLSDLNGEEIVGTFYKKELENTNQKEFTVEKAIKARGDKLYVKWKSYNNSFNSWIDKTRNINE